uniref:Uncharacterized protein n=1 Tax=Saccharum officinarum TaxID=4547 RepID=A0A678TL59_SACOF|nr:hypothetical protein SO155N20_000007 [Saccharum officinarum]
MKHGYGNDDAYLEWLVLHSPRQEVAVDDADDVFDFDEPEYDDANDEFNLDKPEDHHGEHVVENMVPATNNMLWTTPPWKNKFYNPTEGKK